MRRLEPTPTRSDHVCRIEQARAQQHLLQHTQSSSTPSAHPLANQPGRSLQEVVDSLRSLLHNRGTLCSESKPCAVSLVNGSQLEVCLPALDEASSGGIFCQVTPLAPPSTGFFISKACARGRDQHCLRYDVLAIQQLASRLSRTMADIRKHQADLCPLRRRVVGRRACVVNASRAQRQGPAHLLRRRSERCALVLSGHSLKCNARSWAPLIDGQHYDVVLRANSYPSAAAGAGARTDVAFRKCDTAPADASCVTDKWLGWSTFFDTRQRLLKDTGLGMAHSGGMLTDLGIASCRSIDVFGTGMFSRGPGEDVVYQHHFDRALTSSCDSPCLMQLPERQSPDKWRRIMVDHGISPAELDVSRRICKPKSPCVCKSPCMINGTRAKAVGGHVAPSDRPLDFFFQSELRYPVLHAFGLINWVWY